MFFFLGRSIQSNCEVNTFFHFQNNLDIHPDVMNLSAAEIYNAMVSRDIIDRKDAVLIYCVRGNQIQPIIVTHITNKMIQFEGNALSDLLVKFLLIDRSRDISLYVEKLTFKNVNTLHKCEYYIIEDPRHIKDLTCNLKQMGKEIHTSKIHSIFEVCSRI